MLAHFLIFPNGSCKCKRFTGALCFTRILFSPFVFAAPFGVKRLGVLCYFDTLLCQRADDSYINISFNLRSVSFITPVIEN